MPDPRSPIDLAQEILDRAEMLRPSDFTPWTSLEVREIGVMIARWRADQMASVNAELLAAAKAMRKLLDTIEPAPGPCAVHVQALKEQADAAIAKHEGQQ